MTWRVAAAVCAAIVLASAGLAAFGATSHTAAPAATASPSASAPPTPACGPLPTLRPGAMPTIPYQIGLLERDRSTPPERLAQFLTQYRTAEPAIAARAAVAIGRLRNPAGARYLSAAVGDPQQPDSVRAAAAFGLGLLQSPDSTAALAAATRSRSTEVAAAAADAIGRVGGNAAIDALTPLLRVRDARVRGAAAVGLGTAALSGQPNFDMTHRQGAAHALSTAYSVENDPEVAWRIAWAVGRSYYADASNTLRAMLRDHRELVKVYALIGARKSKDRSLLLPVKLLAGDPSWRVRAEVRNALAAFNDPLKVSATAPPVPPSDMATPAPLPTSEPLGEHPQVAFVTTKGTFIVELFPDEAPHTTEAFAHLVDCGFYDRQKYFRVIPNFVVQGGDPTDTGNGGPGFTLPSETDDVPQLTGIISLGLDYDDKTNKPIYDSAGSQYYVTMSPQLHLDLAFTTMGRVVHGLAVVNAIKTASPDDKDKSGDDAAIRVYRIAPVTSQSADVERRLRGTEVGYDPE